MKAVGATNRQILVEIVSESLGISLAGALIGLMASYFAVGAINSFLNTSIAVITPNLAVTAVAFALFIGALAGFFPARQAARLDPVEAIRYE
jgi:putative ABC transport system permease protein